MRKINKKRYDNKIEFWQILSIYKNFDPENILPSIDGRAYQKKVEKFLFLLEKYKPNRYAKNKIIDKIHEEIFGTKLDFEMLLILRKILIYIPLEYYNKEFEEEDECSYEFNQLTEKIKIKSKLLNKYICQN